MSKILVLAPSGFGKTTSFGQIEDEEHDIHIKGLSPANSYLISKTTKPLPWKGSVKSWPVTTLAKMREGRRIIISNVKDATDALITLQNTPIKNVILDDFNYIMQDWYMDNALRTGWDAPKSIGFQMGQVFKLMEAYEGHGKNIFILAHGENVPQPDARIYTKLKTTGKMVDEYTTPEGKFDIVLVGRSKYDTTIKKVVKEYVTNEDEQYVSPKSPIGMLPTYIPNDLGIVVEAVDKYYLGE